MAENVQFENRIMHRVEVEMSRHRTRFAFIRRMLNRCEIIDFPFLWHNDNAAGMLPGGALDTDQTVRQAIDLRLGDEFTLFS